jgi:hypothetical protein
VVCLQMHVLGCLNVCMHPMYVYIQIHKERGGKGFECTPSGPSAPVRIRSTHGLRARTDELLRDWLLPEQPWAFRWHVAVLICNQANENFRGSLRIAHPAGRNANRKLAKHVCAATVRNGLASASASVNTNIPSVKTFRRC